VPELAPSEPLELVPELPLDPPPEPLPDPPPEPLEPFEPPLELSPADPGGDEEPHDSVTSAVAAQKPIAKAERERIDVNLRKGHEAWRSALPSSARRERHTVPQLPTSFGPRELPLQAY
jgi:hypothetical protein